MFGHFRCLRLPLSLLTFEPVSSWSGSAPYSPSSANALFASAMNLKSLWKPLLEMAGLFCVTGKSSGPIMMKVIKQVLCQRSDSEKVRWATDTYLVLLVIRRGPRTRTRTPPWTCTAFLFSYCRARARGIWLSPAWPGRSFSIWCFLLLLSGLGTKSLINTPTCSSWTWKMELGTRSLCFRHDSQALLLLDILAVWDGPTASLSLSLPSTASCSASYLRCSPSSE